MQAQKDAWLWLGGDVSRKELGCRRIILQKGPKEGIDRNIFQKNCIEALFSSGDLLEQKFMYRRVLWKSSPTG
jgi:hypothetical protein